VASPLRDATPKERSLFFNWLVGGKPVSESLLNERTVLKVDETQKKPFRMLYPLEYVVNMDLIVAAVTERERKARRKVKS